MWDEQECTCIGMCGCPDRVRADRERDLGTTSVAGYAMIPSNILTFIQNSARRSIAAGKPPCEACVLSWQEDGSRLVVGRCTCR